MDSTPTKMIRVFAPAKINLYLHVTGRLDNGYHTLDSLIAFTDIGDDITIEPSADFEFHVTGPYGAHFSTKETDASPNSSNLVVQAAWALARAGHTMLPVKITLTKNLPLAAGIGGGSSDAAAALWGLCEALGIPRASAFLPDLMLELGADVPVCFTCQPARVRGVGDVLDPAPMMPEIPVVLVNPGIPCPTAKVFSLYGGPYRENIVLPRSFESVHDLVKFLRGCQNDLQEAAMDLVPPIREAINALHAENNCIFSALSGSGATCFGLFESHRSAQEAARNLALRYPQWWIKAGCLNRPERY